MSAPKYITDSVAKIKEAHDNDKANKKDLALDQYMYACADLLFGCKSDTNAKRNRAVRLKVAAYLEIADKISDELDAAAATEVRKYAPSLLTTQAEAHQPPPTATMPTSDAKRMGGLEVGDMVPPSNKPTPTRLPTMEEIEAYQHEEENRPPIDMFSMFTTQPTQPQQQPQATHSVLQPTPIPTTSQPIPTTSQQLQPHVQPLLQPQPTAPLPTAPPPQQHHSPLQPTILSPNLPPSSYTTTPNVIEGGGGLTSLYPTLSDFGASPVPQPNTAHHIPPPVSNAPLIAPPPGAFTYGNPLQQHHPSARLNTTNTNMRIPTRIPPQPPTSNRSNPSRSDSSRSDPSRIVSQPESDYASISNLVDLGHVPPPSAPSTRNPTRDDYISRTTSGNSSDPNSSGGQLRPPPAYSPGLRPDDSPVAFSNWEVTNPHQP